MSIQMNQAWKARVEDPVSKFPDGWEPELP